MSYDIYHSEFDSQYTHPGNSLAHSGILGMKWGRWNAETTARYTGSPNDSKRPGIFARKKMQETPKTETIRTPLPKVKKEWLDDETAFMNKIEKKVQKSAEGIDDATHIWNKEIEKYVEKNKGRYSDSDRARFAKEHALIFDDLEEAEYKVRNAKNPLRKREATANLRKKEERIWPEDGSIGEATRLELRFDQNDYWAGRQLLSSEGWSSWGSRIRKEKSR